MRLGVENSTPQFAEVNDVIEVTLLQDSLVDAVDMDEDGSESVIARLGYITDLVIDLRDHSVLE
jgi:hypothetical protein